MENELIKTIMEDIDFANILTLDILDEGEQADAYRARKEAEREKQNNASDKYASYGSRANHGHGYHAPGTKTRDDYIKAEYGTARGANSQEKENNERHMSANKTANKEIERREIGRQRPEGERNQSDGKPNPYRQVTNDKYHGKKYDGEYNSYGSERNRDHLAAADAKDRHDRRHPSN